MVGFLHDPNPLTKEFDEEQKSKNQTVSELNKQQETGDPFDIFTPDLDEFQCSFADSFLDFDSLIADSPPISHSMADFNGDNEVGVGGICQNVDVFDAVDGDNETGISGIFQKVEVFDAIDGYKEMGSGGICQKVDVFDSVDGDNEMGIVGISEKIEVSDSLDRDKEMGIGGICEKIEVEREGNLEGCGNDEDLGSLIEEEMEKVSIGNAVVNGVKLAETYRGGEIVGKSDDGSNVTSENGNTGKSDMLKGSDPEYENENANASSSSSSEVTSSDEEDWNSWMKGGKRKDDKGEMDLEEGEIQESDVDEMVGWSEEDEDSGPIRSKNELSVLPPVPLVKETLLPHHQTLPVGVVSAIIGAQVVVEGVEKHNPLSDGSILWITESRSPLGIVDEIFGPVKNPYYIVRYNCESEVPAEIHQGSLISFVPEFANHVLNNGNLYKKGYDVSGENDEEVSADEEFSDDEKEAQYKRMLKMKKREIHDQRVFNKKKDRRKARNQSQNWKHDQAVPTGAQPENVSSPVNQSQHLNPHVRGSSERGSHSNSSFNGQDSGNRSDLGPSFPYQQQAPGFVLPSSGAWPNMIPCQQPQGMGFPNTLQTTGMQWPQQSLPQQMCQMPLPNGAPLQQQFNPGFPPNFIFPFVQPNIGTGQAFAPWPALGQNGFNQPPFGMVGFPELLASRPMNLGGHVPVNGPQTGANNNSNPPVAVPGNINASLNFNQGNHFGGGWNANFQDGCRFGTQARDNSNPQPPAAVAVNGPQTGDNNNSSHPPAAVPGNMNGSLNFNQGNHFSGGWNANPQGRCRVGPQATDNSNSQPPAAIPVNGPQTGANNSSHPPAAAVPGNINGSLNFNQRNHFGGGRRPNRGRGGRFGRGRGRMQRN